MIVYVAGNLLVKEDSLPLRLMPELQVRLPGVIFKELEPTEDMPEGDLTIIDTVVGMKDVGVISNVDAIDAGLCRREDRREPAGRFRRPHRQRLLVPAVDR